MFAPGTKLLGRYTLEQEIGKGGMARVFRARDDRSGKIVAIKQMIFDREEPDDHFKAWFKREVKALMVLDHPGIPRLLDHYAEDIEDPFVVMEFLQGFDLEQAIEAHGPMPEGAAVLLAIKLLDALNAAHTIDIVHRDIKPANIFLCFNGRAVLLDFGLARSTSVRSGETLAGTLNTKLIGTPQYFSPEQIAGGVTLSATSDMFSLGSALYYALAGKHAFAGDNPLQVLTAIASNNYRPLKDSAHWLNQETIAFVEHLMAFEPQDRPARAIDATTEAEGLLRHFPNAEATLRRYVSALEKRERPPAPTVGATVDMVESAPAGTIGGATSPDAPEASHTTISTVVATAPSTLLVTAPAQPTRTTGKWALLATLAALVVVLSTTLTLRLLRPRQTLANDTPSAEQEPSSLPAPRDIGTVALPVAIPDVSKPETHDPLPQRRTENSTLHLQLKQWAEVVIDGHSFGRKQLRATIMLFDGTHTIELKNDRYATLRRTITIKRNQELTLQVDFTHPE